jgi:hypothetical protein
MSPLSRSQSFTGQMRLPTSRIRVRATPRRLFSTGSLPISLDAPGRTIYRLDDDSPASKSANSSLLSDTTESSAWTSDAGSLIELEPPIRLVEEDPFAGSAHNWLDMAEAATSLAGKKAIGKRTPPSSSSEASSPVVRTTALVTDESPIVRSSRADASVSRLAKRPAFSLRLSDIRQSRIGLGITGLPLERASNLMSPFALSNASEEEDDDDDDDESVDLLYPDSDDADDDRGDRARKRRKSN